MQLTKNIPTKFINSPQLNREYPIYPFVGILGTIVGTSLALFLMPQHIINNKDALFPSAVIMTIGLALAPILAALHKPKTILRVENILVLSPIYWLLLDLLQKAYTIEDFWIEGVRGAFFGIGLFVMGIWIAVIMRPWSLPRFMVKASSYQLNSQDIFKVIIIFFSLSIFKYAYPCQFNPVVMISSLGLDRWSAPWARSAFGGWNSFIDHLDYFGYLLPTLTMLLILKSKKFNYQILISVFLSLCITAFLAQGGNRRIIGVIFGAAIICWILEQAKLKIRHFIIFIVSIVLLLSFMQLMLEYRGTGFKNINQTEVESSKDNYLHVDDNFYRLSQTILIVPKYAPFVGEKQIFFTLINPIPRILWHGKPIDPGFNLAAMIGLEGVGLSHSVIGEWYISAGWIAVIFGGWFYGSLGRMLSNLLVSHQTSSSRLVYGISLMALFSGVRSMMALLQMSYALLAWILISSIFLKYSKLSGHQK
jgi:oligosaccharide repeat unit polymerase